jgi:hypothetical protein
MLIIYWTPCTNHEERSELNGTSVNTTEYHLRNGIRISLKRNNCKSGADAAKGITELKRRHNETEKYDGAMREIVEAQPELTSEIEGLQGAEEKNQRLFHRRS